jgi:hypothetical protein
MTTDGFTPESGPGDLTSEPIEADLADDPTTDRPPSGRTYDDETPAADLDAIREAEGGPGLSGLDEADPTRHHV